MDESPKFESSYEFLPRATGEAFGYGGLRVFFPTRTSAGLIAAQMTFRTVDDDGTVKLAQVSPQWVGPPTMSAAPGIVAVHSQNGHQLDAYCFGGNVQFKPGEIAVCELTSAAPILNLSEEGLASPENAALTIVDSLEAAIAGESTHYQGAAEATFMLRLARIDPQQLYAVALTLAHEELKSLPEMVRSEHYWDEYGRVKREIESGEQQSWWPQDPTLAGVLGDVQP